MFLADGLSYTVPIHVGQHSDKRVCSFISKPVRENMSKVERTLQSLSFKFHSTCMAQLRNLCNPTWLKGNSTADTPLFISYICMCIYFTAWCTFTVKPVPLYISVIGPHRRYTHRHGSVLVSGEKLELVRSTKRAELWLFVNRVEMIVKNFYSQQWDTHWNISMYLFCAT